MGEKIAVMLFVSDFILYHLKQKCKCISKVSSYQYDLILLRDHFEKGNYYLEKETTVKACLLVSQSFVFSE